MSKWPEEHRHHFAWKLVDMHNSEIGKYEARIAELELEVAGLIGYNKTFTDQIDDCACRFDRLTAERDELQRRLDAVVKMLDLKKPMPKREDFHLFDIDQWNDAVCEWQREIDIHARAVAIAEGRTE